ncbi:MAG: hypothetical protein U5M23_04605 [Marinagarivorans sp.]|nr:hypothetical protein [Marinagarivorans sp.]
MRLLKNLTFLYGLATSLFATYSFANTPTTDIPAALSQWIPWIKSQHPELACTPNPAFNARFCAWPSVLTLNVDDRGGQFEQRWQVQRDSMITLMGDQNYWPRHVTVNGQSAEVISSASNTPQLHLSAGDYVIKGELAWAAMPQRLALDKAIGLVNLTVNNNKNNAQIKEGNLWLQKTESDSATERDTQQLEVFRFLEDGIPLTLTTIIELKITGNAREIHTGTLQLPNTVTQALYSDLPAKIDSDGSLRLRARSGEWTITHSARVLGMPDDFTLTQSHDTWPAQEIWGFKAASALRQVKIEGPQTLNENQLDLPDFYHQHDGFSLYLMEADSHLKITERLRGQHNTEADALSLHRSLWLDFNGDGFTFKDNLTGDYITRARLNTLPLITLQSANIDGEAQIITQYEQQAGLEIRTRNPQIDAMGRIEKTTQLPINGWQTTLDNTTLAVHLPPGYMAWHLGGADSVNNTWLSQWNLWSIFITLLIVGSLFKLFGPLWGGLALVTSLLTYHTAQSIFLWLAPFCLLLPLLKHLPQGVLLSITRVITGAVLFIVFINVIALSVQQFRVVLYPQLASTPHTYSPLEEAYEQANKAEQRKSAAKEYAMDSVEEVLVSSVRAPQVMAPPNIVDSKMNSREFSQTGPAEPNWQWQKITADWRGSVTEDQSFTLIYSPPWLTRIVILVGIFSSLALVVLLAKHYASFITQPLKKTLNATFASTLIVLVLAASHFSHIHFIAPVQADDFPPEHLLKALEQKITQTPACAPNCSAINRVDISGDTSHLTLNLMVTTAADIAFILPSAAQWQLEKILIDDKAAEQLLRDGNDLLIPLKQGSHAIQLKALATSNNVNVAFNSPAYNVNLSSEQWQARGAENGQLVQGNLALARKVEQTTQEQWNSPSIAPFVNIERKLQWNLNWTVTTTLTRVAPSNGAIVLDIPLINGENVLTEGLNIKTVNADSNAITVTLSDTQNTFTWHSQLKVQSPLTLQYGDGKQWAERWLLDYQTRWHLEASGTPLIFDAATQHYVWLPRPNESLQLMATRPEPIDGPKVTVISSEHKIQQGKRLLSHSSTLHLNASVGGDYKITLPDDAQKIKVTLNNDDIHIEQDNKNITLALIPDENSIALEWQSPNSSAFYTAMPTLLLETPNNNIALSLALTSDRWPLWVWGPTLGPAMLYWGVFVVLLLCAIGLRIVCTRLKLSIPVSLIAWLLLGFGISTLNTGAGLIVAAWFFVLEARKRGHARLDDSQFNVVQVMVFIYTLIALGTLIAAIPMSLLSLPDMQVVGNNSSNYDYHWYTDHSEGNLPSAGVVHVSIWVFRLAMLAWSLWLVFALLHWAKWFWLCVNEGGFWRKIEKPEKAVKVTEAKPRVTAAIEKEKETTQYLPPSE